MRSAVGRVVVFGAEGRTGAAVVQEALAQGREVRAVVRTHAGKHAISHLQLPPGALVLADPETLGSLPPALEGAGAVISCVDPRTWGPGVPRWKPECSASLGRAALATGVRRLLHMSVLGARRRTLYGLLRQAAELEQGLRSSSPTLSLLRVSCYHDEVVEAHVSPPDGRRPHKVPREGVWSPISRRDAARLALAVVDRFEAGTEHACGGPELLPSPLLLDRIRPWLNPTGTWLTAAAPLPGLDIGVDPCSTARLGHAPTELLETALRRVGLPSGAEPHPTDRQEDPPVLAGFGSALRREVHARLTVDLNRLGVAEREGQFTFDFRSATPGLRAARVMDGAVTELRGVVARDAQDRVLYEGDVTFLADPSDDSLHVWFERDDGRVPEEVHHQLRAAEGQGRRVS